MVEPVDVLLRELPVVGQPFSSDGRQPGRKHDERPENGDHEERDEPADLQLKRLELFAPIQHAARHHAGEHGALCEQDWAECVHALTEER